MRTPTELTEAFRAKGWKVTPQRQLLFRLLHDTAEHPTAEAVFVEASALMPGISLRTVYQTLSDLVAMNELHVVNVGGSSRFDPNVDDHQHVVCSSCGLIRDVYLSGADRIGVEEVDDFHPQRTRVVVTGLCGPCARRPSTNRPSRPPTKENHP